MVRYWYCANTREEVKICAKTHTDLSRIIAEKGQLVKVVNSGTVKLDAARRDGLAWQDKYDEQRDLAKDRQESLTLFQRCVVEKNRKIMSLEKEVADLATQLQARDDEVRTHGELWRQVLPTLLLFIVSLF